MCICMYTVSHIYYLPISLLAVLAALFIAPTKYTTNSNLKEEGLILVDGLKVQIHHGEKGMASGVALTCRSRSVTSLCTSGWIKE